MRELVLRVVQGLVDQPQKAGVQQLERDGVVTLKVDVVEGDKGKVIGKQGKVVKAIRALVAAAAAKAGKKAVVEID